RPESSIAHTNPPLTANGVAGALGPRRGRTWTGDLAVESMRQTPVSPLTHMALAESTASAVMILPKIDGDFVTTVTLPPLIRASAPKRVATQTLPSGCAVSAEISFCGRPSAVVSVVIVRRS